MKNSIETLSYEFIMCFDHDRSLHFFPPLLLILFSPQRGWVLLPHPMYTLAIIYQYNMWAPQMREDMRVSWVWPALGWREGCPSVVCCVPGNPLTPGSHHHSLTLHPASIGVFCHLVYMDFLRENLGTSTPPVKWGLLHIRLGFQMNKHKANGAVSDTEEGPTSFPYS